MIMRSVTALSIAAMILTMPSARAQTANVADLTCDDLVHASANELIIVGSWLSGYYSAKHNSTIIDAKRLEGNTQKVLEFCKANPNVKAMHAIEQVADAK